MSNLQTSITPGTVFINTAPGQSSYANLTVSFTNNDSVAASITAIAITLPAVLAPVNGLGSIIPAMDTTTGNLWNFDQSQFNVGEFDASPQSGNSVAMPAGGIFTFSLDMVTLPSSVLASSAQVTVAVSFADGTSTTTPLNVNMSAATASIVFFNSTSSNISPGGTATLQWQCTGIDYCILSPVATTHLPATGDYNVSPPATMAYTLYAYATGIILAAQWEINVANPGIITFGGALGASAVDYGANVDLVWRCNQFTENIAITDNNGVPIPGNLLTQGNTPQKGKVTVGPITTLTSFTLTAYGDSTANFTQQPATIGINDVSAQLTMTPASGVISAKEEVTLSWLIESQISATISPALPNGQTKVTGSGSLNIFPTSNIAYTLTVTGFISNQPATINRTVNITVVPNLINSFTINCQSLGPGVIQAPNVTLNWNTQAQEANINNGIGPVPVSGSKTVSAPPNGTVYTLSAGTTQYPDICKAQVTVLNYCGPYNFTGFKNNQPVAPGAGTFWPPFNNQPYINNMTEFPISNPAALALLGSNQYGIMPYPVTVAGAHSTAGFYAQMLMGYFIGSSWFVGPGPFVWDNPNNQTGSVSVPPFST